MQEVDDENQHLLCKLRWRFGNWSLAHPGCLLSSIDAKLHGLGTSSFASNTPENVAKSLVGVEWQTSQSEERR